MLGCVKALVLDFDGVLFDSAGEAFAVARKTFLELRPRSAIAGRDERALFQAFLEVMPLGNGAADYGAALAMLDEGPLPASQEDYDARFARQDADWIRLFRNRFYEIRHEWAEGSPREWCALTHPYPRFVELLQRRRGDACYAIATAKDRPSVDRLLEAYALTDLFPAELILDREMGPDKRAHLVELKRRLELPPQELTFVDDKVSHLDTVASLGVRCALAAWGYNSAREHRLARSRGHDVCSLEDAEATLFRGEYQRLCKIAQSAPPEP